MNKSEHNQNWKRRHYQITAATKIEKLIQSNKPQYGATSRRINTKRQ